MALVLNILLVFVELDCCLFRVQKSEHTVWPHVEMIRKYIFVILVCPYPSSDDTILFKNSTNALIHVNSTLFALYRVFLNWLCHTKV